ncbi:MAG: uracil-DNA glycosylase [Chromatiales bacterium]|nr:uracil-DNA glycosylase [Chromatiales bacterium]
MNPGGRGLTARQQQVLDELGLVRWLPRSGQAPHAIPAGETGLPDGAAWTELAREAASCTGCPLHASRTQVVFGTGDRAARWMVIGEAPGADEDAQGEPFVGRAGRLLNEMLRSLGLTREQVYIANILKCRPPGNRDPQPDEVSACASLLARQLDLVRPGVILCVGRIAAQSLLATTAPLASLRGRVHALPGNRIPVVVTYHPAYLLRSPLQKRKAWEDLRLAQATLDGVAADQ